MGIGERFEVDGLWRQMKLRVLGGGEEGLGREGVQMMVRAGQHEAGLGGEVVVGGCILQCCIKGLANCFGERLGGGREGLGVGLAAGGVQKEGDGLGGVKFFYDLDSEGLEGGEAGYCDVFIDQF